MKHYQTSVDLILHQQNFWNEDFIKDGDSFSSKIELIDINDLVIFDEGVVLSYLKDEKEIIIIQEYSNLMLSGVAFPPILLSKDNVILDGVHRYLASKNNNYQQIPCIRVFF